MGKKQLDTRARRQLNKLFVIKNMDLTSAIIPIPSQVRGEAQLTQDVFYLLNTRFFRSFPTSLTLHCDAFYPSNKRVNGLSLHMSKLS